jgi:hypothetical protein
MKRAGPSVGLIPPALDNGAAARRPNQTVAQLQREWTRIQDQLGLGEALELLDIVQNDRSIEHIIPAPLTCMKGEGGVESGAGWH